MQGVYRAGGKPQSPREFCSFLQCKKVGHGLGGVVGGLRNLALFEVVSTLILAKIYIYLFIFEIILCSISRSNKLSQTSNGYLFNKKL